MTSLGTRDLLLFGVDRSEDDLESFGTVEIANEDVSIDDDNSDLSEISTLSETVARMFTDDDSFETKKNEKYRTETHEAVAELDLASWSTSSIASLPSSKALKPSRPFSFHREVESNSFVQNPSEASTDNDSYEDSLFCLFREGFDATDGNNEQVILCDRSPSPSLNQVLPKEAAGTEGLAPWSFRLPKADKFFVDARPQCLFSSTHENDDISHMGEMLPSNEICSSSQQPGTEASFDENQKGGDSPWCSTSHWPLKTNTIPPADDFSQPNAESTLADWINATCLENESPVKVSSHLEEPEKEANCAVICPSPQQHEEAKKAKTKCAKDGPEEHFSAEKEKVIIDELTKHDYLIERGSHGARHPCNQRIRQMVQGLAPSYSYHGSRAQKSMIVDLVIDDIYAKGGRILQRDPETKGWIECSRVECRVKVSQKFREEVARVRRR